MISGKLLLIRIDRLLSLIKKVGSRVKVRNGIRRRTFCIVRQAGMIGSRL